MSDAAADAAADAKKPAVRCDGDWCGVCWVGFAAAALGGGMLVDEVGSVEGIADYGRLEKKLVVMDCAKKLRIPTWLSHTQLRDFCFNHGEITPSLSPRCESARAFYDKPIPRPNTSGDAGTRSYQLEHAGPGSNYFFPYRN